MTTGQFPQDNKMIYDKKIHSGVSEQTMWNPKELLPSVVRMFPLVIWKEEHFWLTSKLNTGKYQFQFWIFGPWETETEAVGSLKTHRDLDISFCSDTFCFCIGHSVEVPPPCSPSQPSDSCFWRHWSTILSPWLHLKETLSSEAINTLAD